MIGRLLYQIIEAHLTRLFFFCHQLFQIMKILKNKSIAGLSIAAFELDVVGYTIALSYCIQKGLPFSAYGELFFLYIQGMPYQPRCGEGSC